MPTPPLTDAQCLEVLEAVRAHHGSIKRAAETLSIPYGTLKHRIHIARERGLHLSEGARGAVERSGLSGIEAKGGWIHDYDSDGKKVGTTRWAAPDDGLTEDRLEQIRAAFEGMMPAPDVSPPDTCDSDLLTVYPIADVHIGMMAWGKETGEDYNTQIAVDRLTSWVGQCVASSPASETAIILGAGDLLHADDQTNTTPGSKHQLDVDTRHFKTIERTIHAMASCVEAARAKHRDVIVRIIPGNHDKHAYLPVLFGLAQRYRNDDRVTVQAEPGEFFAHEFGRVLVACHHGDKAKADRMVLRMADEFPEIWGRTRHRFLFTGHLHHHKSEDIGGVQWEQLRAVTARDAYAAAHSYTARAQLQAITFHRQRGEIQRVKVNA